MRVDHLAHPHTVLLADLHVQPLGPQPPEAPAFGAQGNSGSLRVEQCTILSWDGASSGSAGQIGVRLDDDGDVAFCGCTISGGRGADGWYHSLNGAAGGHAVSARSCRVALYDCLLQGGEGGVGAEGGCAVCISGEGGRGGSGYRLDDGFLFVADSQSYGGDGGHGGASGGNCDFSSAPGCGGPGGHGLFAIDAAPPHPNFVTLADLYVPGSGGAAGLNTGCWGDASPGGDGSAIVAPPGAIQELQGRARFLAAPRVAHESTSVPLSFRGVPGDRVLVFLARTAGFTFNEPFHGVNLTAPPPHAWIVAFGTIPPSGTLITHIVLPDLGVDAKAFFLQSVFRSAAGGRFLGSPATLIDLDSSF